MTTTTKRQKRVPWNKGKTTGLIPKSAFKKGCISMMKGKRHTSEAKQKNRLAHLGKVMSEETRKKISLKLRGENNYRWIKDREKIKERYQRSSVEYILWRKGVLKRDKNLCQMAGINCKGRLEVHHILNWIEYPDLRYDARNGITLCYFHHPKGNKSRELSRYFQQIIYKKYV